MKTKLILFGFGCLTALTSIGFAQTIGTASIRDNAITTPKLTNFAVTNLKLAPNAVKTVNLTNGAVTSAKLATNSVSTSHLVNYSVSNAKLAVNAVATSNLRNLSVTNPKLGIDSVGTANIQDDAITANHIANGHVVRSLNSLTDNVTLSAGTNITLTTIGNSIQISAASGVSGSDLGSWEVIPGEFDGIANALLLLENGSIRAAFAPDGSLSSHSAQAGMQVEGDSRINGNLDVAGAAIFENDINILGSLTAGGTICGEVCSPSDRNLKENIEPVNGRQILDQVATLPLSSWTYKKNRSARHIGPMAQDFHAAFGLGADDRSISVIDGNGVALAALQGLNQKVEEQNALLRKEKEALEQRVAALEQLIRAQQKP